MFSNAASALRRRLNFKSTGGSGRSVPKVVIMGSSTASETTINTSTDSANTMVTMVTTTDGEQHDDSLDLDGPPEMSPPAVNDHSHHSNPVVHPPKIIPNSTITENCNNVGTRTATVNSQNSSSTAPGKLTTNSANAHDSPGAPPPTPLVGANQDLRFTFVSGKPALPDLKSSDFFSTPVRGSVDAGQPDPHHISSLLAMVAAKQKQKSPPASTNHAIGNHTDSKNSQTAINGRSEKSTVDPPPKPTKRPSKPNINVTTNPLDISLCNTQVACKTQNSTGARGGGRSTGGNNAGGTKRPAQATIVVQQPSVTDSTAATYLYNEAAKRQENMLQLLDVANAALTQEEKHDFEMRYGSPHHSRSQSVKTPGSRASGRPNYLCLPHQRSRVASMPNTGVEEEYSYMLRHFSITGKGVVNKGDSFKSRRSRSNNSVASSNSSTEHLTASYPGSARNSAAGSLASSRESSASQGPAPYRVLMLGAGAVGKSSLVSQFMTSEHLRAYDLSLDDESGEKTVNVLLAGEESELTFIDHPYADMKPEVCLTKYEPQAYCVVYSATDRESAGVAENVLRTLWNSGHISQKAVILVANKVDLARCDLISTDEGNKMAVRYNCKFIETSVIIHHHVNELLVGLLTQIRLKLENPERTRDIFRRKSRKNRSQSPIGSFSENNSPKKYRGSRTSASLKVRSLLGKVWARDSKSKSCENLHVL